MSTLLGDARIRIRPDVSGFEDETKKSVGKSMKAVAAAGIGIIAAAGIGSALSSAVAAAQESAKIGRITENVIRATGSAAKVSAAQVGDLATALSKKTGMDDELIQSGENVILTFKNIRNEAGRGNDIFNQTTKAALDLSAAGFGSVESASVMLGKALNDPVKGISALTRVGVTFTAQQKEQVKALVASGDMLGAQKVILGEVNGQVGGAAAAAATNTDRMKVALGNLQEAIGGALLPTAEKFAGFLTNRAIPALSNLGGYTQTTVVPVLKDAAHWFQENSGWVVPLAAGLAGLAVTLKAVAFTQGVVSTVTAAYKSIQQAYAFWTYSQAASTNVLTFAMNALKVAFLTNPIGIVIGLLVALGVGLVVAYKHSETFRNIVNGAWDAIKDTVSGVWNNYLKPILSALGDYFSDVGDYVKRVWDGVLSPVFHAVGSVLKWVFDTYIAIVLLAIRVQWYVVSNAVKWAWDNILAPVFRAVGTVLKWVYDNFIDPVLGAMSRKWNESLAGMKIIWERVLKPAFDALGRVLNDNVAPAFTGGVDAIGKAWDGLKEKAKAPIRFVVGAINDGLIDNFNKIATFFKSSKIDRISLPKGFASGGYTGDGGKFEPKGVVHGGEYVFTKEQTSALGVPFLSALAKRVKGYANGGPVPGAAQGIVSLGKWFQSLGARVTEHPAFGGVHPVHKGRGHYEGRAIDVNYGPGGQNATEMAFFDRIANTVARAGYRVLWRVAGHFNHLHAETGSGGSLLGKVGDFFGGLFDNLDPVEWLKNKATGLLGGIGDSPFASLVSNAPRALLDAATSKVSEFVSGIMEGNVDKPAGQGVEKWRGTVQRALGMLGQPATLVGATLSRMQRESGGNPRAINLWDSNAKRGIPSKGLMQVIEPTFQRYALAGYNRDIYDPLSNILASMRYGIGRYGSLARAYGQRGGYALGTSSAYPGLHLVGERGPELVNFRGGESVYTARETKQMLGGSPLIGGDLILQSSGNVRDDIAEANFQLRKIRRGGVHGAR